MKRHGIVVRPTEELGATFNPSVIRLDDGRIVMLVRSVPKGYRKTGQVNEFDDNYTSHLSLWEGRSPTAFNLVDAAALKPDQPYDRFGVEDPRITRVRGRYYIFYTALAVGLGQPNLKDGIRIAMASTDDFRTFKKHGVIGPDRCSKAGAVFESGGKLWFLWKDEKQVERTMLTPAPENFEEAGAWKALWASRDIGADLLVGPQDNPFEGFGIEPGAPPLEIPEGLLTVYSSISKDFKWSISVMLLDKSDPSRLLAKTVQPLLKPEEDYELKGDVNNVVFPCGALIDDARLYVYYGGADTVCAVFSESLDEVMKALKPFRDNPVRLSA